jgi:FecR protein
MTRTLFSLLALAALALPVSAQSDPPSRVARLNLTSGSVSFRPGSVEEWAPATLNYPLTTGDHLWADRDSRTEMHIGSTAVRMSAETALAFLNLDDRTVQLSLTQGSVNIRLRELRDDEAFEVDTPNAAVTLLRGGDYRIDADGNNNVTTVTVRSGDAQVTGGGAAFAVRPRESARIMGMDQVSQEMGPLPAPDEFDSWALARDRHEDQLVQSARYVPRDMIGYEDLDENGVWTEVPAYGWVWRPRVAEVGWAPYRFGHWAWVEPWGWTWIDDAPWGFAPFHYGRWAVVGAGWVWVPGSMTAGVRPVYAPALVAFVGGPRFSVGVSAWFPLGPHEAFVPAYHVSEVYVRQVNIAHVSVLDRMNVGNVRYVNQTVPGAVTAVSHETFVGARPVGRATVVVDARVVAQAQVVGTAAPIPPQRVSVMGHAGPPAAAPPARFVERTVVVRNAPPPAAAPMVRQVNAPAVAPRNEGRQFGNPNRPVAQPQGSPAPAVRSERPAPREERPAAREERRDERKAAKKGEKEKKEEKK